MNIATEMWPQLEVVGVADQREMIEMIKTIEIVRNYSYSGSSLCRDGAAGGTDMITKNTQTAYIHVHCVYMNMCMHILCILFACT